MAQNDDYIYEILLETSLITPSQLERAKAERTGSDSVIEAGVIVLVTLLLNPTERVPPEKYLFTAILVLKLVFVLTEIW